MPAPDTARRGFDLAPQERRAVEADTWHLQQTAPITVRMARGYFSADPFSRCAPLTVAEYNLDYCGNQTLYCQLSGYPDGTPGTDVVGNLHAIRLREAVARVRQRMATYLDDKRDKSRRGKFSELDPFSLLVLREVSRQGALAWTVSATPLGPG
jgi:hypothetical protein